MIGPVRETVLGRVVECLPNDLYRVVLIEGEEQEEGTGKVVLGHLSGTARLGIVTCLPGDRVTLKLSPYDVTRARIVSRVRKSDES